MGYINESRGDGTRCRSQIIAAHDDCDHRHISPLLPIAPDTPSLAWYVRKPIESHLARSASAPATSQ